MDKGSTTPSPYGGRITVKEVELVIEPVDCPRMNMDSSIAHLY